MKSRRFRYLIVFVAAMFITNNAVASVSACLAGLGSVVAAAAMQSNPAATGHAKHAADADSLCLTQCIGSYRDSAQVFAANGSDIVALPLPPGPSLALTIEPASARVALAPGAPVSRLFLLFGNLRN